MRNPIYAQYGGAQNMTGIEERFRQFKQMFSGDPKQQVQQLLNSGRVTQEQYNNAVQIANRIYKNMK